jgi:glycosyltransferase involved in cell wall biosynthesis
VQAIRLVPAADQHRTCILLFLGLAYSRKKKYINNMEKVSVIIPGRCEQFFQNTIDDILKNARGDVEVVAVVDGYVPNPPLVARDERVKIIKLKKSIGQRAGYNLGVKNSTGKYVMKLDAHAAVSEGFDVELQKNCPDNAVVLPVMCRLDPFQWFVKPTKKTLFMYIGIDLYCHYWDEYKKRVAAQEEYPEVMTGQGSGWFCTRSWNDYIGLLDEKVGSWGNVGIEISLRTWLCGGTQIVNRKAWQAHWFRKDGGGFTYPLSGRDVAKAHNYTFNNYYFKDNAFEHQIRPFKWIIEKFEPVPGWEAYMSDFFQSKRAIVYYTDHNIDENIARPLRKFLASTAVKIPIYCVSQKKMDFGINICVGKKERANKSIYEQILAGLDAIDDDDTIVYLCEHDIAYHVSHFAHIPAIKERIDFNQNRMHVGLANNDYLPARGQWALSQIVCYKKYLREMVIKQLEMNTPSSIIGGRPRTTKFSSDRPNVDIRHGNNFSANGKFKHDYMKGISKYAIPNIGGWGSPNHFWKKVGVNIEFIREKLNASK